MADLFTLTPQIRAVFQSGIDSIINQLGRPCKLYLDGKKSPCPNCYFDAVAGRSTGVYNGTGPRPFTRPPCPVCKGTGYDPATAVVEEVRTFTVQRNVKPASVLPLDTIVTPNSLALIKGYAADLPVVLAAHYVVLDYTNAVYLADKYQLYKGTSPTLTGSIVAGRYFTALLQKVEG